MSMPDKIKRMLQTALFGRWRGALPLEDGYTIVLQMPMDMPFLLRFALEGLRPMNTENCKQILVVLDGWGHDGGKAMREVVSQYDDPRIELAEISPGVHFYIHQIQKRKSPLSAANWTHWAMIVEGTTRARCEYAFLHDADAFFIDVDSLECQYRQCRDQQLKSLGVQVRIDEFFQKIGYSIPGTWELMYSVRWARSRNPLTLKGLKHDTPHGRHEFDTMLYPQYLDFPTGKIGSMTPPPRLVHFHGAVTTYRAYTNGSRQTVVDILFRLLLLSILEDLMPPPSGQRIMPTPEELARGLADTSAPITYNSELATREYPIFRAQMEELCLSPTFVGPRAERVRELIRPFDKHYESLHSGVEASTPGTAEFQTRRHWLG